MLAGLPLLLPMIRQDLGLSFAQGGGLASVSLLVYALMQIPAGYLADHFKPRKLVFIGTMGMMSLSLLLAFTRQYWQILGIEFLWGFFSSFVFIPAMSISIRLFSPQRHATATVLPVFGLSLGIFAVNMLFPMITVRYETWRAPFIIFAIAGIIFAMALLIFGKDTVPRGTPPKFRLSVIRDTFRFKQIWFCSGLQFIRFGIVQGIAFWLPSLLLNEKQFPLQLTGLVIALDTLFVVPSNLLGGYLSDRFNKPTLIIGISMIMLGITTGLLVNVNTMWLVITLIFVDAAFMQMYFGPLFGIAAKTLGADKIGISNGVSNMFANIGGLISTYLMGFLRDTTGSFKWGFYTICTLAAIGLILTILLERTRHSNAPLAKLS